MQPPIPAGTVLQNRYRMLSVLGQGGFGRTYLAEDQGRFNELCALKEFIPAQGGPYALEKSKELFQREAQILYQIQHPQVPQFRATFEQDQRLFLVQDYVEGKTYRDLLNDRKTQGYAFSEAEITQLLIQTLPVLGYLHGKGIIHRDIAPDNIILRERDRLPVLIDFGVVKEIATRLQTETVPQSTTVGKLGYAPSEQIQTGRSYPNSDLYALAVTAVVLLTGREPQELFDDRTMTWQWQRWISVSPTLAGILNKMLSLRPGDRYQSATEVLQAFQSPGSAAAVPAQPSSPVVPPTAIPANPIPPTPDASRMPTMAVGRRPEPTNYEPPPGTNRPEPSISRETRGSLWDDPWAVGAIGLGLVILTGLGSWAVVRTILSSQAPSPSPSPTETILPSPSPSASKSPSPSPSPSSEPANYSQRLDLTAGTPLSRSGNLRSNETLTYIIAGQQGQQLTATVSGETVLMTILGPNQQDAVDDRSKRVSYWQGTLPYTGNYYLQLKTVQGLPKGSYRLDVTLQNSSTPPSPSPSPTSSASPSPSPTASPTIQSEDIVFPPNATGTEFGSQVGPTVVRRYILNARLGQVLNVGVRSRGDTARLAVRLPSGRLISGASDLTVWNGELPVSGAYQIDVTADRDTDFRMDVSIK